MKYTHAYTLFLIFVFYTSCKRQNKPGRPLNNINPETKAVTTSQGPITRNIIQDRKGNIWLASWEGIFKYDGKSFTNITSRVSSARFFSLLEGKKGNFWFGSIGAGVFRYDGKSFKNFTTRDGLAGNEVTCIYQDKIGNIWFGANGGISRYDGKSFRNYIMTGDFIVEERKGGASRGFARSSDEINSIIQDKTGKFWLATRGNTFVYDGKNFTVFTHGDKPFTNVRTIIEDKKGNIWLGGNDGLWRYDGKTFTNVTQKFIGYIYEDKKGNIWTSSISPAYRQESVLSRYDLKTLSDNQPPLTEIESGVGMIFGILEDHDGNIWFGTSNGVHRYDGKTFNNFREGVAPGVFINQLN